MKTRGFSFDLAHRVGAVARFLAHLSAPHLSSSLQTLSLFPLYRELGSQRNHTISPPFTSELCLVLPEWRFFGNRCEQLTATTGQFYSGAIVGRPLAADDQASRARPTTLRRQKGRIAMGKDLTILIRVSLILMSVTIGCSKKESPTSYSSTSIETISTQTKQRLLANPDVQKTLVGQSSAATDEALDRLARRGWKRLSDDQLLQRVTIRRKLLSSADVTTCAAVVRDKATEAQTHAALATLDAPDVEAFFSLKETATSRK